MEKKWQQHSGMVIDSKNNFDVINCQICGFIHVIPLHCDQKHDEFYQEEFYEGKEEYIKNHCEDLEWWSIEHNERYDHFEKLLNFEKRRKLLDIGSGPGYFLKVGKGRGWDVTGIEPGLPAFQYSTETLGVNVINTLFSSKNYLDFGAFDVIHMNNVLEHITDPEELLRLTQKILNQDGIISITSPNDYNPLQVVAREHLKKAPWWVSPEEHVNYFNSDSLSNLLKKIGYRTVYRTSSFPLEIFLLMGDDYLDDRKAGRRIHAKRKEFDLAFERLGKTKQKREIYDKLAELNMGRQFTVYAKKAI